MVISEDKPNQLFEESEDEEYERFENKCCNVDLPREELG